MEKSKRISVSRGEENKEKGLIWVSFLYSSVDHHHFLHI